MFRRKNVRSIGYHYIDDKGEVVMYDSIRTSFERPVMPVRCNHFYCTDLQFTTSRQVYATIDPCTRRDNMVRTAWGRNIGLSCFGGAN